MVLKAEPISPNSSLVLSSSLIVVSPLFFWFITRIILLRGSVYVIQISIASAEVVIQNMTTANFADLKSAEILPEARTLS